MSNPLRDMEKPDVIFAIGTNMTECHPVAALRLKKAIARGGIEQFIGFVASLLQAAPDLLDKVDLDQAIDHYADLMSIPTDIIVPDEVVAQKRQQRQMELQQQQQMEAPS